MKRTFGTKNLSTLSADATSKLDVLWHDSDTLGMDGAKVRVLEQGHKVSFAGFLKGKDGSTLETKIVLEILRNLTHKPLERKFADQEVG
mmetsp:Transcript_732/g.1308  ORF Transcript_732/g.1308 Transcript_732/m.1308 type:complete len:89 (-) Transcript_732:377-643(-)